jgi:glutathione S-transferase
MLKVYGHPYSTCTRKVLMTLAETDTPYELITIDFATGEHKQEPHLSRQPFGRVPAIDDEGFQLFESRAICRYLNDKAQGSLVPQDPQDRARMEQWISIETSELTPHAMPFIFEHIFQRKQEPAALQRAEAALDVAGRVLDQRLAQAPYLAGEAFSLADLCYLPYVDYVANSPAKGILAKHPRLMAWYKKLSERPSWRKVTGKS